MALGKPGTARQCLFRRRKEARPSELIRAARDVFVEKGFAATRLEDVAEKAGISKGTIYLYFKNKEVLFKEVIKAGLAPVVATVEALANETDLPPPEQLRRFLGVWQRVMGEAPLGSLLKLLAAESGNFPETVQWLKESIVRPAKRVMTAIIAAGIDRGEFRPIDPELVADIFASPICLYALSEVWDNLSSPHLFLDSAFDMMIRGLERASQEDVDRPAAVRENSQPGGLLVADYRPVASDQDNYHLVDFDLQCATCATNLTPSAVQTRHMVSKRG